MNRPLTILVADWPVQLIGKASNGIVDIVVFPKCSRTFIDSVISANSGNLINH